MKEEHIARIIALEWNMFASVANVGGEASCQSDPETFSIMRYSQAAAWPDELLESYLADLTTAGWAGRNLMSEKYARMMESTFPDEYRKIADKLAPLDGGTRVLVEEIVAVNVEWKLAMSEVYPKLGGKGRVLRTQDDTVYETSFETYLRGELQTYSPKTIRILHRHTADQKVAGINGAEVTLLTQAEKCGYASLAEAESAAGCN